MPPSNTSFATATTIAAFPYDFTQTDINDAGVNFTVYYRFIAPINSRVIGAWGFSGNIGSGYRPTIRPYNGPAGAPTQILNIAAQNIPIQFPVVPGNEYFLEFTKNIDTAGPESLRIRAEVAPLNPISKGNIIVNDDTPGFPLAVLSHLVDNTVINFVKDIAAGEGGDILRPSGVMCLNNFSDNTIKVYNKDFTLLNSFAEPVSGDPRIRTCIGANKFYLGMSRNPPQVFTISAAGVLSGSLETLTGNTSMLGIAASDTETILYFSNNSSGSILKRWDLASHIALSDLAAGVAGYFVVDILYLSDNTIIALYCNNGSGDTFVRRYNTSGTILNTYSFGVTVLPAGTFPRLAYADDTPSSFWIWTHISGGMSRFFNIRVSDGTTLTTRNQTEYEGGIFQPPETAVPSSRFGNSFSCPFFIMSASSSAPPGMFVFVPDKRTDTDGTQNVAIPNPVFKTALMP